MQPLCFVLMPFGKKPDASGNLIDFDAVYERLLTPAISNAGMEPLRADEEKTGGIIHKAMFERLILCDYAIADLTTANANVFYELGVRHAVRPSSTVLIFSSRTRLPFDVSMLRAIPYAVDPSGNLANEESDRNTLRRALEAAMKDRKKDSPLYEMVEDYPNVQHEKTDVFRERVQYAAGIKAALMEARKAGKEAVEAIEKGLGPLEAQESGPVIDLFLSYRAVEAWDAMVSLAKEMPKPLANTVMVQEQLAFALNRKGNRDQAEKLLLDLIDQRGPSSETYGLLGRVYKDKWEDAKRERKDHLAKGLIEKAIDAYLKGFESDWRDAYPGVNAVTLMELRDPPDERVAEILPVVTYSVSRRIEKGRPDYWDHATMLELYVIGKNRDKASKALGDTLASIREQWEPKTTARNIRLICEAREKRGEDCAWIRDVERVLLSNKQ